MNNLLDLKEFIEKGFCQSKEYENESSKAKVGDVIKFGVKNYPSGPKGNLIFLYCIFIYLVLLCAICPDLHLKSKKITNVNERTGLENCYLNALDFAAKNAYSNIVNN